jgi:hypothetical protein
LSTDEEDDETLPTTLRNKAEAAIGSARNDRPYEKQLLIRFISTWGDINKTGLTKLELFDDDGNTLLLGVYDFFLKHADSASTKNIDRLIEGSPYTTDPDDMWECNIPPPPITPELYINTKKHKIGALRIWNYNKSVLESIKGVKEVEIVSDDKLVWSGILNRGSGNTNSEYVTEIILKPGIYLPDLQIPNRNITTSP